MSEDGKTFTFKMNRDAKFSSGNPVTANDAEYSLQRPILLDTRISFILTQFGFTKDNVTDKIKATDDDTLVFTVDRHLRAELRALRALVLHRRHRRLRSWSRSTSVDGERLRQRLAEDRQLGRLGPLRAHQVGAQGSRSCCRNEPNYWGTAPGVERVFLQHMPESATAAPGARKGRHRRRQQAQPR